MCAAGCVVFLILLCTRPRACVLCACEFDVLERGAAACAVLFCPRSRASRLAPRARVCFPTPPPPRARRVCVSVTQWLVSHTLSRSPRLRHAHGHTAHARSDTIKTYLFFVL